MPDMPCSTAPEQAAFTLPARPGVLLLEHGRIDLLAEESAPRRIPEGTVSGFAIIAALVLFSSLVGGVTAGFVVIGVSTLLAACAALVTGQFSLVQVGGQRGANLLLGLGVAALILGSVGSPGRSSAAVSTGTPVPVSSRNALEARTSAGAATAATPATRAPSAVSMPDAAGLVGDPVVAETSVGTERLTLSPDALQPRAATADAAQGHGKGAAKGVAKGSTRPTTKPQTAANGKALGKGRAQGKAKAVGKTKPVAPAKAVAKAGTVGKAKARGLR